MKTSFLTLIIVLLAGVQETHAEPWVSCIHEAITSCTTGLYDVEVCTDFGEEEACLRCFNAMGDEVGLQGCGGPGWADSPRNTQAQQCEVGSEGLNETNGNYSQSIDLPGGLDLNYDSKRSPSRTGSYTLTHEIFDVVPTFISNFTLKIEVAGRVETFPKTAADTTISYTWDGLDNTGQPAIGMQPLVATLILPGQGEISQTFVLGVPNNESMGSDDWGFDGQNSYSEDAGRLHFGNGQDSDAAPISVAFAGLAPGDVAVLSPTKNEMFVFNDKGVQQSTLNALTGAVIETFTYDVNGKLSKKTDAYGDEITFLRNASGELTGIQDADGLTTVISMVGGKVMSVTSPAGDVTSMTYDANGMLKTFTKPSGHVTTYDLDADGNLQKVSYSGGNFFDYAPVPTTEDLIKSTRTSAMGRVKTLWVLKNPEQSGTQTLSPFGVKEVIGETFGVDGLTYWEKGDSTRLVNYQADTRFGALKRVPLKLTEVQGSRTSVTDYTYSKVLADPLDPFSIISLTRTANTNGRISTSVYTGATKTWVSTSPEGRTQTTIIDNFEKPVSEQTGSFTPVTYVYDTRGRIDTVTQGSRVTDYTYNAKGFVSEVENALGEVTAYTYDDDGKIETSTLPDLRVVDYLYNSNNDLVEITPSGKPKHSFLYNAFELVQQYLPPVLGGAPAPIDYVYNADKELIRVDRPDGTSVDYNRDLVKGVLNSISQSGADLYSYDYHTNNGEIKNATSSYGVRNDLSYKGNILRKTVWTDVATSNQLAKSEYNVNDNFWKTKWSVQGSASTATRNIWYQYNDDGQITKAGQAYYTYRSTDALLDKVTMGVTEENYAYNSFGELTGKDALVSAASKYNLVYTRDALGRIDTKTETRDGVSHTYDYDYDLSGRLEEVKTDGVVTSTYIYDGNNNRIGGSVNGATTTATYDDQDRLLTYNNFTFTYNDNGERISRTDTSNGKVITYSYTPLGQLESATMPDGKKVEYTYDGMGRRDTRSYNGVLKTRYIYEGIRLIAEVKVSSGTVHKRYIYVSQGNSPDYMIRWSKTFRLIKDHLGSIVMAVNVADGTIEQELTYDEFGNILADTKHDFQPFGFAGGIYDGRTKFTKFGVRDYDALTGQWTSKDPILFAGGDTKLYGYVGSDPVNYIDPEGRIRNPIDIANDSGLDAAETFPDDPRGAQDAFRHCLASCENTRENGSVCTFVLGELNEIVGDLNGQERSERNRDTNNNAAGDHFGQTANSNAQCRSRCLKGLNQGVIK